MKTTYQKTGYYLSLIITLLLGIPCSCSAKEPSYQEQFNLTSYRIEHFDEYNPILHTFKIDPVKRKEHPKYYDFDVYIDNNDIVQFSFYRSGSYGYLQQFIYDTRGKIVKAVIYPILADSLDKNAEIYTNQYYYIEDKLEVFADMLNGKLVLIDGNNALVYEGILSTAADPFSIKKRPIKNYFMPLLH